MSKLDELIQQYCPDGVIYKRFDEVCTLHARIGWQRLTKAEYQSEGEYLLITGTDFTSTNEINYDSCVYVSEERYSQDPKIQLQEGDILITKDGTLGKVAQVNLLPKPATLNGGVFVVRPMDDNCLDRRFILHYLKSRHFTSVVEQQKTGSTISHLTQGLFSKLLVPLPALPVQREIVRILDGFTLYSAELAAELAARREQYEYYKSLVLNEVQGSNTKLGSVLRSIHTGLNPRKFFKLNNEGANNYYVTIREFKGGVLRFDEKTDRIDNNALALCNNRSNLETNDVLFSGTGTIGETYVIDDAPLNWNIKEGVYALKPDQSVVSPRYLKHILSTREMKEKYGRMAEGGTVKSISMKKMNELNIIVPSLTEQERVVKLLERFDVISNNISIGLPAEIEARQKQYEYYRDKLLTFKRKEA